MERSRNIVTAPMKLHGSDLADYAVGKIDEGLLDAESITIEHALGSAVMNGLMTAEDAYDCLLAYEKAFLKTLDGEAPHNAT